MKTVPFENLYFAQLIYDRLHWLDHDDIYASFYFDLIVETLLKNHLHGPQIPTRHHHRQTPNANHR